MNRKILLINIDSKLPNIALKKIEQYYFDNGDEVIWDLPIYKTIADKIYVSCIFDWNKWKCEEWEKWGAEIGGSGYDLKKELDPVIERIKIKINIGFTTRGCLRKCKFCIVPEKEGKIKVSGDIYDIWDRKSKEIILFDNNILALPEHFKMICSQIRDENLKVDFNQGLDIRLLTDDIAHDLNSVKHVSDIRFAWDNIKDEKTILKGIEILKKNECRRAMFYILVGFDSTIEEDFYRFKVLKNLGQRSYCMRHKNVKGQPFYNEMASWVNQPRFFQSMTFERYQEIRKNRKLLKPI